MVDLQHPQYSRDRQLITDLLQDVQQQGVSDLTLAEIARLRIRYDGFPGARDIQKDLDRILEMLGMSEAELFARTRAIHERGSAYEQINFSKRDDWA